MKEIKIHKQWFVEANVEDVFKIMTDFENFPRFFPKVAESIKIKKRNGNNLEMEAIAKSFGKNFKVNMKTKILPGKGFVSDNDSYQFGTSGHEEFLLFKVPKGTLVDYTYKVIIHKKWLSLVAKPLIEWYAMKFWEKAVIERLKIIVKKF